MKSRTLKKKKKKKS